MGVNGSSGRSSASSYYQYERHQDELKALRDDCDKRLKALQTANPDPARWQLLDEAQVGPCLVMRVKYPNCTNRKGEKVMVYKATLAQLVKQGNLDPHFGDDPEYIYPIARFQPDDIGWNMACDFARLLEVQARA